MKVAERTSRLGTETELEMLARVQALEQKGRDIVHFETGEPDFITPPSVVEAGVDGLKAGATKHAASTGLPELRSRIADLEGQRRGIRFYGDQVVVTPGAKSILFYTILALVEEGNEVLYPDPGFPIYESMISFAGGKPVPYPLREAGDFHPDPDYIEAHLTPRTRLLILNSPNNPTGSVEDLDSLRRLAEVLRPSEAWILSDEVYSHFQYDRDHASIACFDGMPERTIIVDGFSQALSMTGWRLGYGIMPLDLVPHVSKLIVNSISFTPGFIQGAGLAALEIRDRSILPVIEEYRRRRGIVMHRLNRIPGVRCVRPGGSFFVFPNISAYGRSSKEMAEYLLEQGGVACLPGTAFGPGGEGHLRLSFAASMEKLREGIDRMTSALEKLRMQNAHLWRPVSAVPVSE